VHPLLYTYVMSQKKPFILEPPNVPTVTGSSKELLVKKKIPAVSSKFHKTNLPEPRLNRRNRSRSHGCFPSISPVPIDAISFSPTKVDLKFSSSPHSSPFGTISNSQLAFAALDPSPTKSSSALTRRSLDRVNLQSRAQNAPVFVIDSNQSSTRSISQSPKVNQSPKAIPLESTRRLPLNALTILSPNWPPPLTIVERSERHPDSLHSSLSSLPSFRSISPIDTTKDWRVATQGNQVEVRQLLDVLSMSENISRSSSAPRGRVSKAVSGLGGISLVDSEATITEKWRELATANNLQSLTLIAEIGRGQFGTVYRAMLVDDTHYPFPLFEP
jgi:hypothetical protein